MENNIHCAQFLNAVYKNAKMGIDSLNTVIPMVTDTALAADLQTQLDNYNSTASAAAVKLNEHQLSVKDNSAMSKVGLWASVKMNMLTDTSASHIAESIIQGSNMGIIDMTKNLNRYRDLPSDITSIGSQLVENEHNHIQKLKSYLK